MLLLPEKKLFEGSVSRLDVLDEQGNADEALDPRLDDTMLDNVYRIMTLARTFDRKAIALNRTGRMYTFAPCEGHEVVQVVTGMLLEKEDWIFPTYRDHAAYLARGAPLEMVFEYWMGKEDGLNFPGSEKSAPPSIPIASQIIHAAGSGYAQKLKGTNGVSVAFFGDGASSEGDFHEALNFAAIYKTPTIFICSNNLYAISTSCSIQTASESIAQKALAYGMPGVQVNGMDPLAVYVVLKRAIERARNGEGPTLIEAMVYRYGPHTTADDPTKYRSDAEVQEWRKKDWAVVYAKYLEKKGIWSAEYQKLLEEQCTKLVEAAVVKGESYKQDVAKMFDFLFDKMPAQLQKQKQEFEQDLQDRRKAGLLQ